MADTEYKKRHIKDRQEALRAGLEAGGHIQHVVEIAGKLSDENIEIDRDVVNRMKIAAELKMKLINKFLPDLKSTEISMETDSDGKPTAIRWEFVDATYTHTE